MSRVLAKAVIFGENLKETFKNIMATTTLAINVLSAINRK